MELSLEKQLSIRQFNDQVDRMNLEQAQELLKEYYKHMMMKDVFYQSLIKKEWGL